MKRCLALFALLFSFLPYSVGATLINFSASLDGLQETPPNASTGTGLATVTFDDITHMLSWDITFSGLIGGAVNNAHFHGPTNPGDPAGPGIPSPVRLGIGAISGLDSPMIGSADLDDALDNPATQISDLLAGLWYINIHTDQFPAGEIRGQLLQVTQVQEPMSLALLGLGLLIIATIRGRRR